TRSDRDWSSDVCSSDLTGFAKRLYDPIDAVDEASCRPDFAIACYSGYLKARDNDAIRADLRIPADTPPVFLAHASDDGEHHGGRSEERRVGRGQRHVWE